MYHLKNEELASRGQLSLEFPFCDIPINQLFVQVYLPLTFIYGEFSGMREVKYFSTNIPTVETHASQPSANLRKRENSPRMERTYSLTQISMDEALPEKEYSKKSFGGVGTKGVIPVKVEMPITGKHFMFEQLLVSEKNVVLSVEYKRESKGMFHRKRSTKSCCGLC